MLETYEPYEMVEEFVTYESPPRSIDVLGLTAFGLIFFIVFIILRDSLDTRTSLAASARADTASQPAAVESVTSPAVEIPAFTPQEMSVFAAPYVEYIVTQGLHGFSYGHAAVDLAGGKGEPVLSPINGFVTQNYIDQYGNPTLVIENDFYQVTMLHGRYPLGVGERVTAGQQVGEESNQGYTTDMAGRSCAGRDCGYHTHLNVFDKTLGENVNPLDLMGR